MLHCQLMVEDSRAGLSHTPNKATTAKSSTCGRSVFTRGSCTWGSERSTSVDGGPVIQGVYRLYDFISEGYHFEISVS